MLSEVTLSFSGLGSSIAVIPYENNARLSIVTSQALSLTDDNSTNLTFSGLLSEVTPHRALCPKLIKSSGEMI